MEIDIFESIFSRSDWILAITHFTVCFGDLFRASFAGFAAFPFPSVSSSVCVGLKCQGDSVLNKTELNVFYFHSACVEMGRVQVAANRKVASLVIPLMYLCFCVQFHTLFDIFIWLSTT